MVDAFETDYECFLTDFDFDRRRADIERRRLEYVEKMNSASSDVVGKLLAIPVGQGVIVSQLRHEAGSLIGNLGLMLGSVIFFLVGWVLIQTQRHSLLAIKQELSADLEMLKEKYSKGAADIAEKFAHTQKRLDKLTFTVPRLVLSLLAVSFCYSLFAFVQVPPGKSAYGALLAWMLDAWAFARSLLA